MTEAGKQPVYKRVLLKLSGEALMGDADYGIQPEVISCFAKEISDLNAQGVEIGIVIGGGNIFRGAGLAASGPRSRFLCHLLRRPVVEDHHRHAGGCDRRRAAGLDPAARLPAPPHPDSDRSGVEPCSITARVECRLYTC